jgi:hypothetical protein
VLFLIGLALLVTGSALTPRCGKELANTPFYSLFLLHVILVVFLAGWWAGDRLVRRLTRVPQHPPRTAGRGRGDRRRRSESAAGSSRCSWRMLIGILLRPRGVLDKVPQPPADDRLDGRAGAGGRRR